MLRAAPYSAVCTPAFSQDKFRIGWSSVHPVLHACEHVNRRHGPNKKQSLTQRQRASPENHVAQKMVESERGAGCKFCQSLCRFGGWFERFNFQHQLLASHETRHPGLDGIPTTFCTWQTNAAGYPCVRKSDISSEEAQRKTGSVLRTQQTKPAPRPCVGPLFVSFPPKPETWCTERPAFRPWFCLCITSAGSTHIRQAHGRASLVFQLLLLVHDITRWPSAPEEAVQKASLKMRLLLLLRLLRKHKSSPTAPRAETQEVRSIAARESFVRRSVVGVCPPSHGAEHISAVL